MWDVAIIGAGPAGCAAAIALARAGANVGLLERSSFPRRKLCGEFLSPEAVRILDELGCGESFRSAGPASIGRALIVTRSGARIDFPLPSPAHGLSRFRFDHLLAEAAQAAGAELMERAEIARADTSAGGNWRLETRNGRQFQARRVLLAAGRHSMLQPLPRASSAWFGFKAHYEGECTGRVEVYFFPGGYCGVSPVEGGGRVNVCCLVEKSVLAARPAEELLASVPVLCDRLTGFRRLEPFLYAGPVVMGWRRPPPGLLPAGDAALFVDPFTGDGMSLALETGRMAAAFILRGGDRGGKEVAGYLDGLRRRFGRQLRAARWLRLAASASPWLERLLARFFAGERLGRAAFRATRLASASDE